MHLWRVTDKRLWFVFLANTSNRIRCINWRTQLHGFMRDTEFLKHAEGNSEGISKFLLLKTTSTQEAKMKMSLNAFKTNVYFY